jgi:hypothetical protein
VVFKLGYLEVSLCVGYHALPGRNLGDWQINTIDLYQDSCSRIDFGKLACCRLFLKEYFRIQVMTEIWLCLPSVNFADEESGSFNEESVDQVFSSPLHDTLLSIQSV